MGSTRAATHQKVRQRMRRQMEKQGVPPAEIDRRLSAKAEEQRRSRDLGEPMPVENGRVCEKTGKVRFGRTDAHKAAMSFRRRYLSTMQHYRCGHCGSWHIGHPPASRKPKVRR